MGQERILCKDQHFVLIAPLGILAAAGQATKLFVQRAPIHRPEQLHVQHVLSDHFLPRDRLLAQVVLQQLDLIVLQARL